MTINMDFYRGPSLLELQTLQRQRDAEDRARRIAEQNQMWAMQDRAMKQQKIAQEEQARKKFQQAIQPSPLAPFANMVSPLVGMISPDAQKNLMGAMQPSDQQYAQAAMNYDIAAGKDPTSTIDMQMKLNAQREKNRGSARNLLDQQKAQQQFMAFASKEPRKVSMWPDAQLLSMGIAPENIPRIRVSLSSMADMQEDKEKRIAEEKAAAHSIEIQLANIAPTDPRYAILKKLYDDKMARLQVIQTSGGMSVADLRTKTADPLMEGGAPANPPVQRPMGGGVGSPENLPLPTDVTTAGMPAAYEIPPQNALEPVTASGPTDIAPLPTSNAPVDFNMPALGEPALPGGPKRVRPPVKAATKASEVPEGLSEVQKLRFATQWGNSFTSLNKRYRTIEESALPLHQAVDLVRKGGANSAPAQEMIKVLWAKLTDPTTGVREGEFNRDARFKSSMARLESFVGSTLRGESFLPEQLDQMDEVVNILQDATKTIYNQDMKQYQERFKEIDPTGHLGSVFLGPSESSPSVPTAAPTPTPAIPTASGTMGLKNPSFWGL